MRSSGADARPSRFAARPPEHRAALYRRAENDLLEAWLFIAEDNPKAADRVVDAIDREARQLTAHPHMGRERPELAAGLRSWPTSTPYILFYSTNGKDIVVARVLHHARDIGAIGVWQA